MQVADRLVGLFGRRGLGRGGGSHGFRCEWHLADGTVVESSGYTPQLSQLQFKRTDPQSRQEKQARNYFISIHCRPLWPCRAAFMSARLTRRWSKRGLLPCCELLSSCRQSQGKVFGLHSVPTPRWCGGSHPPRRSCPGWSPPRVHHVPLCLQRCCTPQSVGERMKKTVNYEHLLIIFQSRQMAAHIPPGTALRFLTLKRQLLLLGSLLINSINW